MIPFIFIFIFICISILTFLFIKKFVIENYNSIPKTIIQTYIKKDRVPKKVFDNIKKFAPDYQYTFFDDDECLNFIINNYDKSVVDCYNNLSNKAHKSDLFRYCYLYKHGGIYLDIKIELIKPIKDIFIDNKCLYTVLSIVNNTLFQGLIATPPKNKIFLDLINFIKTKKEPFEYHTFTKDFYNKIYNDTKKPLKEELNIGKNMNYYLFKEKCTSNKEDCYDGLDNKGLCCFLYDKNQPIIKVRYADYPW